MNKKAFAGLFLAILFIALLFRLFQLDLRPMHHDEANQAVKFGNLLEKGEYKYDRFDHHGPSLYYLSIPLSWILSGKNFPELTEITLRLVPSLFGAGVILFLFLLKDRLNSRSILFSSLLISISPIMVFFSRFYIQEMPLAFFTLGFIASLWQSLRTQRIVWFITAGLCAGFMFATKETSIIIFGSLLGSLLLLKVFDPSESQTKKLLKPLVSYDILYFLGAAFLIWLLLYSSFFQHMNGLGDSIRSLGVYFKRAGGDGAHTHPWYYYLKMLLFSKYGPGPLWSEALVVTSALIGGIYGFTTKAKNREDSAFIRFVFFYTLISTLIFSFISYKTPWNIIPFYLGMLVLAGFGISFLIGSCQKTWLKSTVLLLILMGIFHLGWQSWRANFKYYADPRNPYVYAQTSTDFLNLVQRIKDIAEIHPGRKHMLIKVIADPHQMWPLPWYLRGFEKVGYWTETEEAGKIQGTPVLISSVEQAQKLSPLIQGPYQSEFYGLRHEVLLCLHIRRDLWNRFLKNRR
ncbi:MAG: flippase activity-associated protein Agl23 [Acidobacteriota bacterium]